MSNRMKNLAGPTGIEPATYGLRVRCSALLSHGPTFFKKENRLKNIELTVSNFETLFAQFILICLACRLLYRQPLSLGIQRLLHVYL